MKTLIIYNDTDKGEIKYIILDGDFTRFHNVTFNVGDNSEVELECGCWLWDEEGNFKHNMTNDINILESKEWDKVALITWVP